MGNRDIVNALTSLWPRDRLAPDFESYWPHKLAGFPASAVVDALKALRHERDPFAPTTDAVEDILARWGVERSAGPAPRGRRAREATPEQIEAMRDRFRRPPPEDEVAQTICDTLDDATFARLATEVLASMDPDARITVTSRRPLRDSTLVKRLVADLVRRTEVAA